MSETKDWRKICADCQEGEPPKDCEYFGEPGGCNAPTMGKHPTCKESLQVGNAAALCETLLRCDAIAQLPEIREYKIVKEMRNLIRGVLALPPRNCDVMDWRTAWAKWRTELHPQKPCGYAEVVGGTEQFMDWYMSEVKGGAE